MGEQQSETSSTVSGDDITVYQTYTEEKFNVPTVVLKAASEWNIPTRVRLSVPLPPEIDIEEVGFHPEYRSGDWTIDDRTLTFVSELNPDEELTTMYAVESLADEQRDVLLDNLVIDRIAPVDEPEGAADDATDAAMTGAVEPDDVDADGEEADGAAAEPAASVGNGVKEGAAAAEDQDATEATEDQDAAEASGASGEQPVDAAETSEERPADGDEGDEADETPSEADEAPSAAEAVLGGVAGDEDDRAVERSEDVEAGEDIEPDEAGEPDESAALSAYGTDELVAELRERLDAGDLSEREREQLRDQLVGEPAAAGLEARVEHLQQRVSDAEAFADSMEQLHEEYGHPADAFASLEEELASVTEQVETLTDGVESIDDRLDEVEPRLDSLEDDVGDATDDVAEVRADIDAVEDEQSELAANISELNDWREQVMDVLGAFGSE